MSETKIDPTKGGHIPDLRRASMAILEHMLEPVLGEVAIQELKDPYSRNQLRQSLAKALTQAEGRFTNEYGDTEVCEAILDLPLANMPQLASALGEFYMRPTDPGLAELLKSQLRSDFPQVSEERVNRAVTAYLTVLQQELVVVSPEIREKLVALAVLLISKHTERIANLIEERDPVSDSSMLRPGNAPRPPSLIIGREDDLRSLKYRLGATGSGSVAPVQVLTASKPSGEVDKTTLAAVRGWPGVGKTTLAAALAYDAEITAAFPDGVLWISLGQTPNLLSELATWGRALGNNDLLRAKTVEEASTRLAALLRNKHMLLVIDDVWEAQHALPFQVGGPGCATLITTRVSGVAQALAPTPGDIYRPNVLSDENALELLQVLAPQVVAMYPKESLALVRELEGLPLAIQVAGHLLQAEISMSFSVTELLAELHEGTKLLEARAPADRTDLAKETTPTVAVLWEKSTDRLDPYTRECFAFLGPFAPKPATFDLEAMKDVWEVEDPKPIARILVERGLLEPVPELSRFQMHALLVMHAKSLLT